MLPRCSAIQLITVTLFTVEPPTTVITTIANIKFAARQLALKLLAIKRAAAIAPQAIPNEPPRQPAPDYPVVRAAVDFPRSAGARAPFSPTLRFSMTKSSFCFLISWTFW